MTPIVEMLGFAMGTDVNGVPTKRLRITLLVLTTALALTGCEGHVCNVSARSVAVDPSGNGVLEPGETVQVVPTWVFYSAHGLGGCPTSEPCASSAPLGLFASSLTGPNGGTYAIVDGVANYGTIPFGQSRSCADGGNCYEVSIGMPSGRPVLHWDAELTESSTPSAPSFGGDIFEVLTCPTRYLVPKTWALHVGASFTDVAPDSLFYSWIETALHNQITAGCGAGQYCPGGSIRRDQMAVFLLKAKYGPAFVPGPCTSYFVDMPCPGPFTDWAERAFADAIIPPCGTSEFCPSGTVSRRDMARWLLKAKLGSTYQPPAAQGIYVDVPVTDPDAAWIEDLYHRQVTAGCAASPPRYCPDDPNTRGQMAVFVDKTFELALY